MKNFFRLQSVRPITRKEARACCTANLVLPGTGSLMAGRWTGWPQAALCLAGFLLSMVFGTKFVFWGIQHWAELHDPYGDPAETLLAIWHGSRFALLGIFFFSIAWLWALCTSLAVLSAARRAEAAAAG